MTRMGSGVWVRSWTSTLVSIRPLAYWITTCGGHASAYTQAVERQPGVFPSPVIRDYTLDTGLNTCHTLVMRASGAAFEMAFRAAGRPSRPLVLGALRPVSRTVCARLHES